MGESRIGWANLAATTVLSMTVSHNIELTCQSMNVQNVKGKEEFSTSVLHKILPVTIINSFRFHSGLIFVRTQLFETVSPRVSKIQGYFLAIFSKLKLRKTKNQATF